MELRHRNLAKFNQEPKKKKRRDRLPTPVFLGFL